MTDAADRPLAVHAADVPPRIKPSNYPPEFAVRMDGRTKQPLGDLFGLVHIGINRTRLAPGAVSALVHRHTRQEEFVYVLEGHPTLVTDAGEVALAPGMCAGFPAGGVAHQLANRTDRDVVYLEMGDRVTGDEGEYPHDDLVAVMGADGKWAFARKDGTPY
jgi:uncharacterized cupin superfamily protein